MKLRLFHPVAVVVAILCSAFVTKGVTVPWRGDGSKSNPYLINSAADFDSLSVMSCDTDFYGMTFRMEADIKVDSAFALIPLFRGCFDGAGHTLEFNISESVDSVALFRVIGAGGSVTDLTLTGTLCGGNYVAPLAVVCHGEVKRVTGAMDVVAQRRGAGVVAVVSSGALLDSCIHDGTLMVNQGYGGGVCATCAGNLTACVNRGTISGSTYMGGVTAQLVGSGCLSHCRNEADINLPQSGNVAGIVAYTAVGGYGWVHLCENSGNIFASQYAGGILARPEAGLTVDSTLNTGRVGVSGRYAGGIVAQFAGDPSRLSKLTDCENQGDVSGGSYIGGLAGFVTGSTVATRCNNKGAVSHVGNGGQYIGGLCGMSFGRMQYCFNTGSVAAPGCYGVGGLVGAVENSFRGFNCYNVGDVTASNAPSRGKRGIAGGLIGDMDDSYLQLCYNLGKVKADNAVGGLVGLIHSFSSVTACYTAAAVTGVQSGTEAQISAVTSWAEDADTATISINNVYYDAELCTRFSAFDLKKAFGVSTARMCENPLGAGFDKASWCYPLLQNPAPCPKAILASACIGFMRAGDNFQNVNANLFLGSRPELSWSVGRCFDLLTPYEAKPIHRGLDTITVTESTSGLSRSFPVVVTSYMEVSSVDADDEESLGWYTLSGLPANPVSSGVYLHKVRAADGIISYRKMFIKK